MVHQTPQQRNIEVLNVGPVSERWGKHLWFSIVLQQFPFSVLSGRNGYFRVLRCISSFRNINPIFNVVDESVVNFPVLQELITCVSIIIIIQFGLFLASRIIVEYSHENLHQLLRNSKNQFNGIWNDLITLRWNQNQHKVGIHSIHLYMYNVHIGDFAAVRLITLIGFLHLTDIPWQLLCGLEFRL